ncbi:MAG: beta-galactosidase [Christensenellales bacterium]|jgi:hypothetical protein
MYTIKDGILYKNGKKRIALGTSYYASYHPTKWPVPPDGDRMGEMIRDIREIAEAGYDHIRLAAFGDAHWEGDTFVIDTAFQDAMIHEIAKRGMRSFVRLHGYSMNHRGHTGTAPVNEKGETPEITGFMHDTLNHAALNKDMDDATMQQAAHFATLPEMLGFQILNEPAYSNAGGFFDYNPHTIAAYREWLAKTGRMHAEDAAVAEPPRCRPCYDEDPQPWVNWRVFSTLNISNTLIRLNQKAKEGAPLTESFSCPMPCPMLADSFTLGEDFFSIAEGMDILGLTQYMPFRGEAYFFSCQVIDALESAAALQGKRAWMIEFCCRTHMIAEDYQRQMYTALGCGLKGINYYLWRADAAGPEEQLGGMVWNDRTRTMKFDDAVAVNQLINRLSEELAEAEKLRDHVAILYSLDAAAWFDAVEGGENPRSGRSRWFAWMQSLYTSLKKLGVTADFVRACDLAKNKLDTRLLILPGMEGLSEIERRQVEQFATDYAVCEYCAEQRNVGLRFHERCGEQLGGYPLYQNWCYRPPKPVQRWSFRMSEALRIAGISPTFRVSSDRDALGFGYLENKKAGYYYACLTSIDSWNAPITNGKIIVDEEKTGRVLFAICYTHEIETRCAVENGVITLPTLDKTGGCLVRIEVDA